MPQSALGLKIVSSEAATGGWQGGFHNCALTFERHGLNDFTRSNKSSPKTLFSDDAAFAQRNVVYLSFCEC